MAETMKLRAYVRHRKNGLGIERKHAKTIQNHEKRLGISWNVVEIPARLIDFGSLARGPRGQDVVPAVAVLLVA